MPFPDSVDDRLWMDGLNVRTTQDITFEEVGTGQINLNGTVRVNGETPATTEGLTAGRALFNNLTYTTIQAAIDAAELVGGGCISVRPGAYDEQIVLNTTNRIRVEGHGTTLRASANSQTIVTINHGLGVGNESLVVGFKIDGNGFTGVTGLDIQDSVGGKARNCYIEDCAVGARFSVVDEGSWCEFCGLSDSFVYNCAVGIQYYESITTNASFAECWLDNVGITGCTLGIDHKANCDLTRVSWKNVTVWVVDNQTGIEFAGRLDFCRLQFHIESLDVTPSNIIGVHVAATFAVWADARSIELSGSFVGSFTDQIDNDSAQGITIRSGANYVASNFGAVLSAFNDGEAHPRIKLDTAGIALGPGDATPTAVISCGFSNYVTMAGRYFFQLPPAFDTESASAISGITRAFEVWDKDTGLAVGWVPVYTTRTP